MTEPSETEEAPVDLRWKVREVENKQRKRKGLPLLPEDPDDDGGLFPYLPPNPEPPESRYWDR